MATLKYRSSDGEWKSLANISVNQSDGAGGADWNAEEGEPGYIENKPFGQSKNLIYGNDDVSADSQSGNGYGSISAQFLNGFEWDVNRTYTLVINDKTFKNLKPNRNGFLSDDTTNSGITSPLPGDATFVLLTGSKATGGTFYFKNPIEHGSLYLYVIDTLILDSTYISDEVKVFETNNGGIRAVGSLNEVGGRSFAENVTVTASGNYSHAEGYYAKSTGEQSHAEGNMTTASGNNSHAEGYATSASGDHSHAEGYETKANGKYSHAEGYETRANGMYSHTEGYNTETGEENGLYSHAEGDSTNASGYCSHAEGSRTLAGNYCSHAEGQDTKATGQYAHAEGSQTEASGDRSHAEGFWSKATGNYSHAEGYYTEASGEYSHTDGANTKASGSSSRADGYYSKATGAYSHASGYFTEAKGDYSRAIGYQAESSGMFSHANGYNTQTTCIYEQSNGVNNISINSSNTFGAVTNTLFTVGNGKSAKERHNSLQIMQDGTIYVVDTDGEGEFYQKPMIKLQDYLVLTCYSENYKTLVKDIRSYWYLQLKTGESNVYVVLTDGTQVTLETPIAFNKTYRVILECDVWRKEYVATSANDGTGGYRLQEPNTKTRITFLNMTKGDDEKLISIQIEDVENSVIKGKYVYITVYEIVANQKKVDPSYLPLATMPGQSDSHFISQKAATDMFESIAVFNKDQNGGGYMLECNATGLDSIAEGYMTTAAGEYSHTEGYGTRASGNKAHAEGWITRSNGENSHAEGYSAWASGNSAHAEGSETRAYGMCSHAEGRNTTADGDYSHAEGSYTNASGSSAHAEGGSTKAYGSCSHAEGGSTKAIGDYSHAEGSATEALNEDEHASGTYNISLTASTNHGDAGNTLFTVGNGLNSTYKHNAFQIMQNGDIYIPDTNAEGQYYRKPMIKLQEVIKNLTDRIAQLESKLN